MEVDRIFYIFGSFTRKKDKRKSFEQSSLSAGNSPLRLPRTHRAVSQNLNVAPRTSAYDSGKSPVVKEWQCGLCRKELVEPRLLGCLHSFCTQCLQGLHQEGEAEAWSEVEGSIHLEAGESSSASGGGSAGSGYESDLRHSGSDGSWDHKQHKYGIFTRKISGKSVQFLLCPTCGHETPLPLGGIAALPLNYVLLRRMLARQGGDSTAVLCDLCNSDNKAESRCHQCMVSVCTSCGEAHGRQKATARHSLHPMDPLPVKYCSQHPRAELSVYCATCQQVVCRDCCIVSHSGHALANASRAAAERARLLRDACDRAKHVPENVERAVRILNSHAFEADTQAARVESEVQTWAEQYRRAVEAHGRALCNSATRARDRYRQRVDEKTRDLHERAQQAVDAVKFAEVVLAEAREDELLSLSGAVSRRLERLTELQPLAEPPRCELRFAPDAPAAAHPTLVGRLLTHAPDPDQCLLNTEGFQDLRVDCPHEAILELRDSSGERIWCGGEQVCGYFRRRDCSQAPVAARVTDRGDGRYSLRVTPPKPGGYLFAVTLNNKPIKVFLVVRAGLRQGPSDAIGALVRCSVAIRLSRYSGVDGRHLWSPFMNRSVPADVRGSPFQCAARVSKAHTGQYHCCAFCSSGGKRDVTCGCGATMAGGYKGCGHGHAGWPGGRHWSCCGSTQRKGLCGRDQRPNTHLYQFSL